MMRIITILLLCCLLVPGYSTDGLSKETWEELVKDINYTEEYKEFEKDTTKNEKESQTEITPREFKSPAGLKTVVLVVIGAILLALVVFLILSIARAKTPTNINTKINIEEVDDPSQHKVSDLERYLLEAIESGDYRLALRIQFLMLIKALNEANLISWKKDKTNFDYYHELLEKPYQANFRSLVLVFEKTWYANYTIDRASYQNLTIQFNEIHQTIQS